MSSSFLFVVFYSSLLFGATLLAASLPLLVHMSKNTSKIISLIGVGLMLGTSFIVVVPEAILRGCECLTAGGEAGGESEHLESKNIGLAIVLGFIVMMLADSFSHKDHDHSCNEESNEEHSDDVKEEVVVNITEMSLKKLRSSVYGLCLHSLFDGLVVGSSVISANVDVIQTIFWAILLHKISASLGVGIFIRQLHVAYKQGIINCIVLLQLFSISFGSLRLHLFLRFCLLFSFTSLLRTFLLPYWGTRSRLAQEHFFMYR